MKIRSLAVACLPLVPALLMASAQAQGQLEQINYNGEPVQGYRGAPDGFPEGFLGLLCEAGASARDAQNSCIQLNRDGNGQWEHDRAPGRPVPPVPVSWWVLADQQGAVTRIDQAEGRQTWILLFRFEGQYYSHRPGDWMRHPASRFPVGSATRYIVHTKYRDR